MVHEGADGDNCGSCRPVSRASVVLKSLESVLRDRIVSYLEANKSAIVEQHDFRHKRSYLINLISFLSDGKGGVNRG